MPDKEFTPEKVQDANHAAKPPAADKPPAAEIRTIEIRNTEIRTNPPAEGCPDHPALAARLIARSVPDERWKQRLVFCGGQAQPDAGELDLSGAGQVQDAVNDFLARTVQEALPACCLDLRQVVFADSVGLALIIRAYKHLAPAQIALRVLLAPGSQPGRILRLAGFGEVAQLVFLGFGQADL